MASLTRKANCRYWIGCFTDATGKQRQRSTRLTDRLAAQRLTVTWEDLYKRRLTANQARRVIADVVKEITGENVAGETVAAFLSRWAERKAAETSASTATAYKALAVGFTAHLGERANRMFLDELTTTHIATWRDVRAKGRAPSTANHGLKILRVALQDAMREGLVMQNAAALVPTVKIRRGAGSVRHPFTMPQLRRVLKAASDEWRGLVLAGLYTGQRLGDLARLTWQNIDLEKSEIFFTSTKTDRRIVLPLAAPLHKWIDKHAGDDPTAPLFPHAFDIVARHGRVGQLSRQFHELLASAGLAVKRDHSKQKDGRAAKRELSSLSFHALRHTATSLLKNAGVSDVVAMDIIGHDSAAISQHYTHIESATKRDAINKLPDVTR